MRMARLLRAVPELMMFVKGMGAALQSVIYTLILLVILLYVFAVVFKQLTDDTTVGRVYFESVPHGMNHLLLDGVLLDGTGSFVGAIRELEFPTFLLALFYLFVLLSALTVMN